MSTLDEAVAGAIRLANEMGLMGQRGHVYIVPPATATGTYALAWMPLPILSATEA